MNSRLLLTLIALGSVAMACASAPAPGAPASNAKGTADAPASTQSAHAPATDSPAQFIELGDDLKVKKLESGLWLHVSSKELPGMGVVPSNGLLVVGPEGTLLIDTPWTPEQTERLLAWLRESQHSTVVDAIATHFHADRLGGISALPGNVRIHVLPATSELAARQGTTFPATPLQPETSLLLAGEAVQTFYPGAGHTHDNIVVWLPQRHVLYGGCFVKSAHSADLGNVADADISSWRTSVQRVIERYPSATVVVPGHGDPGGTELLVHTRDLVDASLAQGSNK